jgi:uncharacterized protein YabE (DUF348 family)/3D (Asp-Asp-Asp) domain-containing protein
VTTHENTVEELLDEQGMVVGEHDELSQNLDEQVEDGMEIELNHAKQMTVMVDGSEQTYFTTADTVGDFLTENNLSFTKHDDTSFDPTDMVKDGLQLKVNKAFQVTVNDGGEKDKYWATGGTINEFLHGNNITYKKDSDDKIKPGLDKKVTKDTTIAITRIEKMPNVVLEEAVPFETDTKKDDSLAKGKKKVIEEGKEGKRTKTYAVVKKNGKETKELVDNEITEKSENRIVAIGTMESKPDSEPALEPTPVAGETKAEAKPKLKPKAKEASETVAIETVSHSNDSSAKVLHMSATAFTADCSGCSGYTATGIDLHANPNAKVIAVDPNVIPLGSKVWVEGYGYAIAGDTGGFSGNNIDLHVATKADAQRFGRKNVKVKIMD